MSKGEMIEFMRKVEACPPHQEKLVPCPDGNPGCCVAHLEQRKAVHSAACCAECAWLLAKAILQAADSNPKSSQEGKA